MLLPGGAAVADPHDEVPDWRGRRWVVKGEKNLWAIGKHGNKMGKKGRSGKPKGAPSIFKHSIQYFQVVSHLSTN